MNGQMIHCMKEQQGIVLTLALLVMVALSVLGLAFLTTAQTEDTIAANYRNQTAAFYAAEAGTEAGIARLKSLLRTTPTPSDTRLTQIAAPVLTNPNYTFDAFQVRRVRATPPYNYQTTLTSGAYTGLVGQTTDYLVTATVRSPRGSQARLTQKIQHVGIPLFQFGAFYGRGVDLEIFPGPPMTFIGRIHSNSNLYLRSGNGLKIDSYVTTTGKIYRNTKPDPSDHGTGAVEIKDASGNYKPLNFDHDYDYDFNNPWTAADWTNAALSTFDGKVQDSAMGVQEIVPPIPDAFYDPNNADKSSHLMIEKGTASDSPELKDAKMYYKAGLIIENTQGKDQSGSSVNLATCKDANNKQAVRTETLYDGREKKTITVTQIDVGALTACNLMPANGILYVSKDGSNGGVRLVNGAQLPGPTPQNPNGGLTVVSGNPVYVQGDYNTKTSIAGVDHFPAAVLGDAITVLSNAWGPNDYDKKGKDKTPERPAADTTVNAAFAMGPSHESELGKENGQLNNLIRFLEDWKKADGKKTFTYRGSLVALWHSQQATEWFQCCGDDDPYYYHPPERDWGYDPLFNTQIPPGTPMGIIIVRGQWSEG